MDYILPRALLFHKLGLVTNFKLHNARARDTLPPTPHVHPQLWWTGEGDEFQLLTLSLGTEPGLSNAEPGIFTTNESSEPFGYHIT